MLQTLVRWRWRILASSIAGALVAGLLFCSFPTHFRVVGLVQGTSLAPDSTLPSDTANDTPAPDPYRELQLRLIKGQLVFDTALEDPDVARLSTIRQAVPDASTWLQEVLQVSFAEDGETLEVRYEGPADPDDMLKVIDAVVTAYQHMVLRAMKAPARQEQGPGEAPLPKAVVDRMRTMQSTVAKQQVSKAPRYAAAGSAGFGTLALIVGGCVLVDRYRHKQAVGEDEESEEDADDIPLHSEEP